MNTTILKYKVKPINSVEEGIKLGNYTSTYDFITDKTVPLKEVTEEKEISLVCFGRMIEENEYISLLKEQGLKPLENAPNYLLGLMEQFQEKDLPESLKNKDIVAANVSSVFADGHGRRCFLCVSRGDRYRRLDLTFVGWQWIAFWVFLAEALETETLSSSLKSLESFEIKGYFPRIESKIDRIIIHLGIK